MGVSYQSSVHLETKIWYQHVSTALVCQDVPTVVAFVLLVILVICLSFVGAFEPVRYYLSGDCIVFIWPVHGDLLPENC